MVELGDVIDPELNARVRALDELVQETPFPGYREAIPSYRSLLVLYEPTTTSFHDARAHIEGLLKNLDVAKLPEPPLKTVATVYDGADLDNVSRETGLLREDVIRLHSESEYRVYMVGFTPGFAYMGLTDPKLDLERRATPRTRVPAGSVAIAMRQTAIYPSAAPGGWHLIGRAEPRTWFDANRSPPSYLVPGDRVKFTPVDALPEPERLATTSTSAPETSSAPAIEVEHGGLVTTVQDRGRHGFQRLGVPVAGALDVGALDDANRLVGNDAGAAGLECTIEGPRLRCLATTIVSITGADLGAVVERSDLGRWEPPLGSAFRLRPGNVLGFGGARSGARAYVGFAGGIDVPRVLGSRSTYLTAGFGGYHGRALQKGDLLALLPGSSQPAAERIDHVAREGVAVVRVMWGPQDHYFTEKARATFQACTYTVGASSDRMGYRLEGDVLEHRAAKQIISDGNAPGSIQVPPDGLPIVMLADRATTGGYPKIATVVSDDIPKLAQLPPGAPVRFVGDSPQLSR